MYMPKDFAVTDRQTQLDFIREIGWGYLTGMVDDAPCVTHLPFLLEENEGRETLVAHMARANPHWQSFASGKPQLVVFPGPHCYISPSWYQSKKAVPTWNYTAAHVYGVPSVVEDPELIYQRQQKLVAHYEAQLETPWRMEDVDKDFIDGMLRAIVSFEMPIDKIECKFKLSQNRTPEDRASVIETLNASNNASSLAVAALMQRAED